MDRACISSVYIDEWHIFVTHHLFRTKKLQSLIIIIITLSRNRKKTNKQKKKPSWESQMKTTTRNGGVNMLMTKRHIRTRSRSSLRNNGYDSQKDQINTLDRRTQTTIFRLRTGHCGLRKHLKRLGLADSAHCECGSEEQTPEHILQTCPHLETVRQQFWPEDTEVGTKLWGQAAELQRTADFLAATGLRI